MRCSRSFDGIPQVETDDRRVAEFTSLSRRQLERHFRSELNRTPHQEITAAQITKVKQLLRETETTLEQIARLADCSDKESLSDVLQREVGGTPGEFRRRIDSAEK